MESSGLISLSPHPVGGWEPSVEPAMARGWGGGIVMLGRGPESWVHSAPLWACGRASSPTVKWTWQYYLFCGGRRVDRMCSEKQGPDANRLGFKIWLCHSSAS